MIRKPILCENFTPKICFPYVARSLISILRKTFMKGISSKTKQCQKYHATLIDKSNTIKKNENYILCCDTSSVRAESS